MSNYSIVIIIIIAVINIIIRVAKKSGQGQKSAKYNAFKTQINNNAKTQTLSQREVHARQNQQKFNLNNQNYQQPAPKPAYRPTPQPAFQGIPQANVQPKPQAKAQPKKRYSEGDPMNRKSLEGISLENRMQSHMHSNMKSRLTSRNITESSMGKGFAGEGCQEHYDIEIVGRKQSKKQGSRKGVNFSKNPYIQGIIMTEVLNRRNPQEKRRVY